MKKRKLICGLALGMVLLSSAVVSAATFTTDHGVLSIETPDAEDESTNAWMEIADPNHWFMISDGRSTISIDHFSNGESLPQVQVADANYAGVFQAFTSTRDEVFVVKATATREEDMDKLIEIVGSIEVLKTGTKTAITSTQTAEAEEFSVRQIDAVYYVNTDELNVRSTCSTESNILGVLYYGEEVHVTGVVQRNGSDYGWYRITYNGREAYVSAAFLSEQKPSSGNSEKKQENNENKEKYAVSNGFTAYDGNGNNQGKLVKYSDGYYYSNDMQPYRDNGDGSYYGVNTGDTLYNYDPSYSEPPHPSELSGSFQVWDGNGNIQGYLVPNTDGYYYSNDSMPYRDNGDGSYYGINTGDTLYSYDPSYSQKSEEVGTAGSNYYEDKVTHLLSEQTTGTEVYVSADDAGSYVWMDANGTEYQNNGDGTFTDYYGNDYDLVY